MQDFQPSTILSFWTLRWLKGQNVRKMHIKTHKWTRLLTGPWSHGTWIQWDQARYSLHSSSTCTWHKPGMSQSVAQNTSYIRHHSYISHTLRLLWFKRTSFSSLFRFGQDPQKNLPEITGSFHRPKTVPPAQPKISLILISSVLHLSIRTEGFR